MNTEVNGKRTRGWVGVDLDKTLAKYESWAVNGKKIGEPVPAMLERVKRWLAEGTDVRIFTARATDSSHIPQIQEWCQEHLGKVLPITATKDFNCVALWDDIAVSVAPNDGVAMTYNETDPLTVEEETEIVFQMKWDRGEFEGMN